PPSVPSSVPMMPASALPTPHANPNRSASSQVPPYCIGSVQPFVTVHQRQSGPRAAKTPSVVTARSPPPLLPPSTEPRPESNGAPVSRGGGRSRPVSSSVIPVPASSKAELSTSEPSRPTDASGAPGGPFSKPTVPPQAAMLASASVATRRNPAARPRAVMRPIAEFISSPFVACSSGHRPHCEHSMKSRSLAASAATIDGESSAPLRRGVPRDASEAGGAAGKREALDEGVCLSGAVGLQHDHRHDRLWNGRAEVTDIIRPRQLARGRGGAHETRRGVGRSADTRGQHQGTGGAARREDIAQRL